MEKIIATYRAQSDDGTVHEIYDIQEYENASSQKGIAWIEGMKRLELADGRSVTEIDENSFEIIGGEIIRRI